MIAPLLAGRSPGLGDLGFHIREHSANHHLGAFAHQHRFLGAGRGVPLERGLVLGQRMAAQIESEQFFFETAEAPRS